MVDFEPRAGKVVAVSLSDSKLYPKFPQDRVVVGQHGFEGDAHSGELRPSHRNPKDKKKNDRAISIVADEVRQDINQLLGLDVAPGGFNENLLVEGIGDLSDLEGGEHIIFSGGVELVVTGQNPPCTKLEAHNGPGMMKATIGKDDEGIIINKRGVVATVVQSGELQPGEEFTIQIQRGV